MLGWAGDLVGLVIWLVWAELGYAEDFVRLEIWMGQAGLEI